MNNVAMAKAYIIQAVERIGHSEEAMRRGNYPYVIRQCQEAVELLLKAALRLVGVEPPKWHDVGAVLKREVERFPGWFRSEVPELARISRKLRREREPAMYGDEESGLPPNELYDEEDAREALQWATCVSQLVSKLFKELTSTDAR